jgi:hypothetical protein
VFSLTAEVSNYIPDAMPSWNRSLDFHETITEEKGGIRWGVNKMANSNWPISTFGELPIAIC